MKVRFQADADLNQTILLATIRREPAIDFQTATMAGLLSVLDDMQVLERTAREGRVLATHDRKTMPRHFSEFIAKESSSGCSAKIERIKHDDEHSQKNSG